MDGPLGHEELHRLAFHPVTQLLLHGLYLRGTGAERSVVRECDPGIESPVAG